MAIIRDDDLSNVLIGTSGDDVIFGNGGDDTISGGAGNDRILGGTGFDSINGGSGDDVIEFRNSSDADPLETISGGTGFDTLLLSSAGSVPGSGPLQFSFQLTSLSSIERLQFASGLNDINASFELTGAEFTVFPLRLEFVGGAGQDNIWFAVGDADGLDLRGTTFTNWQADDRLTIIAYGSHCTVNGSVQADDIWAGGSQSLLRGNAGDDLFHYSLSSLTTIDGGAGYDRIILDTSGFLLNTWLPNIEEVVFAGPDAVVADFFSEAFDGGAANPFLHFVDADAAAQVVRILMFDDTHFSAADFTFENWDTANIVGVAGTANNDTIIGSTVRDDLEGGGGNDLLRGGQGSDVLFGGAGDDRMNGGDGDDYLSGDNGVDILSGGFGNDTFAYSTAVDSGVGITLRDNIVDFGIGDKIDLSSLDASATLTGDQAFALDTNGILTEGEIQFVGNLNTLIRINLDADPEADMEIFLRGVAPGSLSAADFIL